MALTFNGEAVSAKEACDALNELEAENKELKNKNSQYERRNKDLQKELNIWNESPVTEKVRELEGYKLLAEERRLFITYGAEFGIIEPDYFSEDKAATEVFERCKLTDECAIAQLTTINSKGDKPA